MLLVSRPWGYSYNLSFLNPRLLVPPKGINEPLQQVTLANNHYGHFKKSLNNPIEVEYVNSHNYFLRTLHSLTLTSSLLQNLIIWNL